MKKVKLFAVPALLAACMLLAASSSFAQAPQIMAVGSSGAFVSVTTAMVLGDSVQGFSSSICGSNVWTYKSASLVYAVDPRSASIPNEPGTVAVVWDNSANPQTVCTYMNVDSVVGDRLFLGQSASGGTSGNGYLHLDPSVSGTPGGTAGLAGQNQIGFIQDSINNTCGPSSNQACGLPPAVYALVNGAHFNMAFSDIRPEDARYAYGRAACSPADEIECFGYGPLGGVGTAILSTFNSNSVSNVIAFSLPGSNDPFNTSLTVPAIKTINVGAYPIMIFYNASDTTAGGLGALLPTNILSHVVTGFWSGQLGLNQDLMGVPVSTLKNVDVVQREVMSGTYNTFEFQAVHDRDGDTDYSQETGFTPTSYGTNCFVVPSSPTYADPGTNCSNPERVPGLDNHRFRGIGTGELVAAVNAVPQGANRIGYGFYSLGTFAPSKAGNTKYMKLDGVDPLYPAGAYTGNYPSCSGFFNASPAFSCTNPPTFDGVKSGNYRVWNIIRAVRYANCTGGPAPTCYTPPSSGPSIDALVAAAQDQAYAASAADFVPFQRCTSGGSGSCSAFAPVLTNFRSHYSLSGLTTGTISNGNGSEPTENGGDMAGAIFPITADEDYYNLTGNMFIPWIQ